MISLRRLLIFLIAWLAATSPALCISLKEEIELGRKLDAEILKQHPLTDDEKSLARIKEFGDRLIQGVRRPEIEYYFRIIKGDDLNAFAIPGGYVYFTERLWNTLRDDERIGVLAHEIVHVDRRHALDAMSKQQRRRIWMAVILAATGASRIWGDIAGLAESLYTLKYSRGDEQQADEVGVELCEKAGFNPVGLLLAMRKIQRFQSESGGEPPKIFSSHPPTRERLNYLEKLLTDKGLEIPPDKVVEDSRPYLLGKVSRVEGRTVHFASPEPLANDDIVWLMKTGWDYYYEKRVPVPVARAVVTGKTQDGSFAAETWLMPGFKREDVKSGIEVYAPPAPRSEGGVGVVYRIDPESATTGRLEATERLLALDRLLARQAVWNTDGTELVTDNVGYVVILDAAKEIGFVAAQRSKFAYAPVSAGSTLVRLLDPDQDRWVGPVVSIGRGSKTVEVVANRALSFDKTYEVAYPAWNPRDSYRSRVVGTARFAPQGGKMVLKMTGFSSGWTMERIQTAFDIYEAPENTSEEPVPEEEQAEAGAD